MRRLLAPGIILLALLTAGCGATPERATTLRQTAGTASAATENTAGSQPGGTLASHLLTLSDMPTGFTQTQPSHDTNTKGITGCASAAGIGHTGTVEADFNAGQLGPFVTEVIARHTTAQAQTTLANARTVIRTCRTFRSDGNTYNLTGLSFPRLGDDTVAFAATITSGPTKDIGAITLHAQFVEIRVGGLIALITNLGLNPDGHTTEQVARRAAAKLTT